MVSETAGSGVVITPIPPWAGEPEPLKVKFIKYHNEIICRSLNLQRGPGLTVNKMQSNDTDIFLFFNNKKHVFRSKYISK